MTLAGLARRVRRLAPGAAGRASTALLVPVPDADPVVGRWRDAHDPMARLGIPAHVTVLTPFLPAGRIDEAVERGLAEVAAATPAFEFRLASVARFPGSVLYLAPEPAAPFVTLTEAVVARWPDHPPYGGEFDEIVPHLTVADHGEPPALAEELAAALPIAANATELWLIVERADGSWRRRAAFPLGQ